MDREARVALHAYTCLAPDVVERDGVTVIRSHRTPQIAMLNRVVGLGIDAPATEPQVDWALTAMGDHLTCYVSVAPDARPAELGEWLRARGLEPGRGWMLFRRGIEPAPPPATSLRLVRVGAAEAQAFGRVVATAFGLPDAAASIAAAAFTRGWDCWLALDGDEPAAAAGVFVSEGVGYLGLAGTLSEHRGKGGQTALLAARIDHARAAGCDALVTETGELLEGMPAASYRNLLRAGFVEAGVRAHWVRQAKPVTSH